MMDEAPTIRPPRRWLRRLLMVAGGLVVGYPVLLVACWAIGWYWPVRNTWYDLTYEAWYDNDAALREAEQYEPGVYREMTHADFIAWYESTFPGGKVKAQAQLASYIKTFGSFVEDYPIYVGKVTAYVNVRQWRPWPRPPLHLPLLPVPRERNTCIQLHMDYLEYE